MLVAAKMKRYVQELRPIFWVAIGVVAVGTVTGSIFDRIHRVAAEESGAPAVAAVADGNGGQVVTLPAWGVRFTLPIADEMPLLSYAVTSPDAVGFTSEDLAKLGPACSAARSALGSLLRYPGGSFGSAVKATPGANLVATMGNYDYVYQFPVNACADTEAGTTTVNREESVVLEAMSTLGPVVQP